MIYLTYGESPTGVYQSQVIDVCRYLDGRFGQRVRLVAVVSPRTWRKDADTLRRTLPGTIVIPALPRVRVVSPSIAIVGAICAGLRESVILARSVPAANVALRLRGLGLVERVGLDGRGAIAAERREYLAHDPGEVAAYERFERDAVIGCDARIAVSERLVEHWRDEYGYRDERHVVIPCTLPTGWGSMSFSEGDVKEARARLGLPSDSVVIAYSGSTSSWQSFDRMGALLRRLLESRPDVATLFLSGSTPEIERLATDFPGRVLQHRVTPEQVRTALVAADYGLMVRSASVTNRVASPTKLAEYLSAGMRVIVSEGIGDYSRFVVEAGCGLDAASIDAFSLGRTPLAERGRISRLASERLTKEANEGQYRRLVAMLMPRA
jgi:hypothetical protein